MNRQKPTSMCCDAELIVQISDEGTGHFDCAKCGKPCDMRWDDKKNRQDAKFQQIDPVAQIFMDFYANLMEPNDDGETHLIIYQQWANLAREAVIGEAKGKIRKLKRHSDCGQNPDYPMDQCTSTCGANAAIDDAINILDSLREGLAR